MRQGAQSLAQIALRIVCDVTRLRPNSFQIRTHVKVFQWRDGVANTAVQEECVPFKRGLEQVYRSINLPVLDLANFPPVLFGMGDNLVDQPFDRGTSPFDFLDIAPNACRRQVLGFFAPRNPVEITVGKLTGDGPSVKSSESRTGQEGIVRSHVLQQYPQGNRSPGFRWFFDHPANCRRNECDVILHHPFREFGTPVRANMRGRAFLQLAEDMPIDEQVLKLFLIDPLEPSPPFLQYGGGSGSIAPDCTGQSLCGWH
jgi:hypothetical protein